MTRTAGPAELAAARLLLERMGIAPADLLIQAMTRSATGHRGRPRGSLMLAARRRRRPASLLAAAGSKVASRPSS